MASCLAPERVARFAWSGREEEREHMPLYMSQVGYTSEAVAALTRNPEDRSDTFERLAQSMGGRLLSFYYSFGEYDGVGHLRSPRPEHGRSHRDGRHHCRASQQPGGLDAAQMPGSDGGHHCRA